MDASPGLLAIVIPAYRGRFLRDALASLAAQTDQRFALYVCDDGSPEDLRAIFESVFPGPPAGRTFVRFEENWGGASLVRQWNRCVAQTGAEPWIWLFSDDDLAGPQCVERFYKGLDRLETNVWRFCTASVDPAGAVLAVHPPHPPVETAAAFAYHRLVFQRMSFVSEYIFRRTAYAANGGFVDFPFALGSDDASWIVFAGELPLVTLPEALVYWRISGDNVSLLRGAAAGPKLLALADFSRWLQTRFRGVAPPVGDAPGGSEIDLGDLARHWFDRITWNLPPRFSYLRLPALAAELARRGFGSRFRWTIRLAYILFCLQAQAILQKMKRLLEG